MQELVIIENGTITGMLADASIVAQVPCLQSAAAAANAQPSKGCGKCGRKNSAKAAEYTSIKNCLASMSSDNKMKLKQILNATRLRIVYVNNSGRIIKLTF
jgi:hypothetical protein